MRPYAVAIGQLALSWNDLHEAFGLIFLQAVTFDVANMRQYTQLQATWGVIQNDRLKRDMAAKAINWVGAPLHVRFPRLGDDILWAVRRATTLEDHRNNVLHSPLYQNNDATLAALMKLDRVSTVIPGRSLWGLRPDKLTAATIRKRKDLLKEIRGYRDAMAALDSFVRAVHDAWQKQKPWPERPQGPHLQG